MIQLIVNNHFLDVYEQTPPKLSFQIEDIRTTEATSVFSRQFRVPATNRNTEFFKTVFLVNGQDFDVTLKYNASILVDGVEFRRGQFRLNKVYVNEVSNVIDYECIFFGETKSFASQVGEGFLNELDLTEYVHVLILDNVKLSWEAYPEGALTDGLFEGDILYPLIDHGNTYGDEGNPPVLVPQETRISAVDASDHFNFTKGNQQQNKLIAERFKPMIRLKVLIDKIFAETDYTYLSNFLESNRVRHMYVSAFGNQPSPTVPPSTQNIFEGELQQVLFNQFAEPIPFVPVLDPGSNWTIGNKYVVPLNGNYDIRLNISGQVQGDAPLGGEITVSLLYDNGIIINSLISQVFTVGAGATINFDVFDIAEAQVLEVPGEVWVQIDVTGGQIANMVVESNATLEVLTAPGLFNPGTELKDDYKKLDFFKDILTRFRLVMQPDPSFEGRFIIEPWQNWIGSGEILDWTHKVDLSKDIQISPLFYTQQAKITFKDQEDLDFLNKLNIEEFGERFGELRAVSQNELLSGERVIESIGLAPTPITQIEGSTDVYGNTFVIPQVHVHESGNNLDYPVQHLAMTAKTRLLFYNGMKSTGTIMWYTADDINNEGQLEYPMVSYYELWPTQSGGLNLNWQRERGYIRYYDSTELLRGRSQYEVYWAEYINSLYNSFARRVTVNVKLSTLDLQTFSFDDVVFIKDTYYYVERINDVLVGQDSIVKVDLIKLDQVIAIKNQVPPPPEFFWNTINENYNEVDEDWNSK